MNFFINLDLKEQDVKCVGSDLSPPEKVQQALDCLPLSSQTISKDLNLQSFRRWTILDYSRAYNSLQLTPKVVSNNFNF